MNKKKLFSASLASVAVLGAAFVANVNAEERPQYKTTTEPTDLKITDLAPVVDKPVAKPADKPAAKPADKSEKVTVLKPVAKPKEIAALEAKPAVSPAELAARAEFLANFDKALELSVKELEKAETNSPEEAKQKAEIIAKLKEVAAANRAEIVEAFANGATAADAEKFIAGPVKAVLSADKGLTSDDLKKLKEADIAAEDEALTYKNNKLNAYDGPRTEWVTEVGVLMQPVAGLDKADPLYNYDKQLEEEGFKFVKTETKDGVTRHYYENTLIAKKTLWVDEEGKTLFAADGFQDENFEGNHEKLDKEGYDFVTVEEFDTDENETVVYYVYKKGTSRKGDSLVQPELPEYPLNNGKPSTPAGKPSTPAVAGTDKDNTYKAPAAKEEAKKEEAKAELPKTGTKENAALASVGFLGLVLGALPFAKRKN